MAAGAVLLALFGVLFVAGLVRCARRRYYKPLIVTGLVALVIGVMVLAQR